MEIVLQNVTKRFGDHLVLDGVDLRIRAGETTVIIGPSGSGKSTLLRCLNGLTPFDAGRITVGAQLVEPGGRTPHEILRQVRLALGMVFQDFQLFPHLTALENVAEAPFRVTGLSKEAARARALGLLDRVGMAARANAYPGQLSGGQKQRVAIARALAMEPRGLLCDEITSALDAELKHEVLSVIEDLKRDKLTVVMVTHEIGFARRAADKVVVLAGGRVVEEGAPEQVLDHPAMPRTQAFLRRVMS